MENVQYSVDGNVASVMMDRPQVRNALSTGMFRDLRSALKQAESEMNAHVIKISGAGRSFSAGLDIREVGGFQSRLEASKFVYKLVKPFWEQFFKCDKPILSLVDGPAYGAGAEIALASDIVIASAESTFAFSGGRVGALCCISGVIGPSIMKGRKLVEMNLTGAPLNAKEAQEQGLVNYSVAYEELVPTLDRVIQEIRHVSPISNASFKRIRDADISKTELAIAYKQLLRTITSEDFQEGSKAFNSKRRPEYYH